LSLASVLATAPGQAPSFGSFIHQLVGQSDNTLGCGGG
jgi:hypothetical protein